MRRNGTADHKWQRSEQLGHNWSGATMLGSVKYLQQRSMHQYNQNICQCYSHGRLSQQEQGNLKVEATGNFEPPTCLPHAKRSANAPPGSFPPAFPHTKTIQLTCNCATPKSRGCGLGHDCLQCMEQPPAQRASHCILTIHLKRASVRQTCASASLFKVRESTVKTSIRWHVQTYGFV